MMNLELLSIDLSNYCSKQCPFCYNHSDTNGKVAWVAEEVIALAKDCIVNGVKAISLGGGEPFEYDGIFRIIDAIRPIAYISITTNGMPLADEAVWQNLMAHSPDKIHITIHNPDNDREVCRVLEQLHKLLKTDITPGVNLLVASDKIEYSHDVYAQLRTIIDPKQIILVPQRFSRTPTPEQLAYVANDERFQAPSCILGCRKPTNFCSVSWDKKVNFCSYAGGKQPLKSLSYQGLIDALDKIEFQSCADSKVCDK